MSDESENIAPPATTMTIDKIVDERGVPLGNTMKEMTRKLNRLGDISQKLDMILQNNVSPSYSAPDKGSQSAGNALDVNVKNYIDSLRREDKQKDVEKAQTAVLGTVFKTFPELDKSSDEFDSGFFDLAVEYEKSIDQFDPDRSIKAAKLAALDLGKVEKLTKAKVLQDDARRSRILSEGGTSTKESTAKSAPKQTVNKANLARYFKIDSAKVEKYAKGQD